ncbi:MAG TPA: DNA polymerase III subunit delta, partial [Chitinophagales bacterium]|nr:DNA polymerase III subunit delta [Chitinophagales bacterium]
MTQTHTDILRDLQKKIYHPIYLLEGEEPYFIDMVSNYIEHHVLPEAERSFNQTILYGKETTALDIRTRAMNYPMFSNYQVLMVKEAQALKKWDDLVPYLEKPVPSTILVLCHKYENFDKRTKAAKMMKENGVVFTSKKMYENQLPAFIQQIVEEHELTIQLQAMSLIVEYIGNDLSRIVHELEKLMLNLRGKKEITPDDIELNIGISKEYNTFELNKALAMNDVLKANRIVEYFAANPRSNPLVLTLGSLQAYFSKIFLVQKSGAKTDGEIASTIGVSPYVADEYRTASKNFSQQKVETVFSLLHEYDLRSKGVNDAGTKESALLKELVYKILH